MILYGKPMTDKKYSEMKEFINTLREKQSRKPTLAIIRVGNDLASERYVNNKVKQCKEVGIESKIYHLKETVDQREVEYLIHKLNGNYWIDAILLQLPLPKHLDEYYLTNLISPEKDVDGFTATNIGKLLLGEECNVACTPQGIIHLLKHYEISIEGKDVLIINRSNIVGKPLLHLFLQENATPIIAHSKTKDLMDKVKNADIIVTAIGKANFFKSDDFRPGQTIIDVSINFDENGKMCGDVCKSDYDKITENQINVTPVPGGIGTTTVSSLLENTIKIYKTREKL